MAGNTFVTTVEAGLNTMVASARIQSEFPNDVMPRLVDRQTLEPGTGTSWRETLAAKLDASNYGETDVIDNPQDMSLSTISFSPQLAAIETFIGKRVQERLSPKAYATFGELAQNAIQRKKDKDGLAMASTATTTLGATGTSLASGVIAAAGRRITSNTSEPGMEPIACVLHGYQIHDLYSEIIAGIGTYAIPDGYTAETFKSGFKGMIHNVNVYEDGNIAINATPDATGMVFAKRGIVLVQGMSPWTETKPRPEIGYGGNSIYLKDEYVYGERSAGNWLYGVTSDATAPTS
jgi:hypothetical protein